MKINFKSWLPHILAIVLFAIIAVIYFLPTLQGKAILQPDINNFLGAAKEIIDFRGRFHTEPLWTNSMFGGMPAFQVSTQYPANLVHYLFLLLIKWLPFPAGVVFLYCLGFYILLKVLKVDSWVAIIGAVAFAFSSFFFIILSVGHNSEANAIAFMAPTFAGVILAFDGKRLAGGALTALSLALELDAGHLQITYYLLLMLSIYGITQFIIAIKNKQIPVFVKTTGILALAAMLAVSTNITSLWLTYQYGKFSTRGKSDLTFNPMSNQPAKKSSGLSISYATQWSYGVPETMTLMIPDYMGGASEPIGTSSKSVLKDIDPQYQQAVSSYEQYWGDQPGTSGPVYAGAIVCFLALMGFFIIKGPMKWFLFAVTVLSVMLSWGKNFMSFYEVFFYHLPGFNKFRAVSMILVLAELTLPLLAALALDKMIKDMSFFTKKVPLRFFKNPPTGMKVFIIALALTGGFSLMCYIIPGTFSDFHKQNEIEDMVQEYKQGNPNASETQIRNYLTQIMPYVEQARKKVFTSDAIRSAIFILLAAGLFWVYYRKLAEKKIILGVLLFFVLMDMYNVDKRYLNDKNFTTKQAAKEPFQPDQADLQIAQDTSPDYRVYNTTIRPDQDSRTSYFHKSLGGYSGVKMKRYDEILPQIEEGNMSVIDMLNAKYFIVGGKDGQNHAEKNPGALGNAWFVNNYKLVPNADSEYTNLTHFNPGETAIVNQPKFGGYLANAHIQKDTTGFIKLLSYEPNHLVYKSSAKSEQLAVFSEIYYKDGWDASIDGKPAEYIQANYILRAMLVPAGNHEIVFKFEPKEYSVGEKISLAGSLLLLLGCLGMFIGPLWKPKE